jgi:hypothetical protein
MKRFHALSLTMLCAAGMASAQPMNPDDAQTTGSERAATAILHGQLRSPIEPTVSDRSRFAGHTIGAMPQAGYFVQLAQKMVVPRSRQAPRICFKDLL